MLFNCVRRILSHKVSFLVSIFLLVSVFAFAQTVGGTAASDDFDGDGIINSIDLDDDNDGVLDAVESPTCFNTANELSKPIAVSSELAPYLTYAIGNSIDNSPTTFSGFAPSVNWVNKEIFKFTAVDVIGITGISFEKAKLVAKIKYKNIKITTTINICSSI